MTKLKLINLILIILSVSFLSNFVFAYDIETHAYLTKEIIDFYNQNFSNKIPPNLEKYLIDGSRKEDEPPRWMNHFYDPVYNRGLSEDPAIDPTYRLGNWQASKYWANDSINQNNPLYKTAATIFSILSALEQKKIELITSETDFTWRRALKFYIQDEKEKAAYILGHILHLIEDSSVPDHTRNDPHPGDSPYEKYTSKYNLSNPDLEIKTRLKNKQPIIFNDLNSYFDNLANYSNNNFYSKDTIGIQSGYSKPQPDYFQTLNDGRRYGILIDKEFGDYPLSLGNGILELNIGEPLNRSIIMSSYWSRLSTKAIQNGAGVIDLFFREAEANKNNPEYLKPEISFWDKLKNTASNIFDSLKQFGSQVFVTTQDFFAYVFNSNKQNIYEIPLNQVNQQTNQTQQNQINQTQQNQTSAQNQTNQNNLTSKNKTQQNQNMLDELEPEEPFIPETQLPTKSTSTNQEFTIQEEEFFVQDSKTQSTTKQCSFSTNQSPTHQGIIINEISWMGTPESSNNEWIELKNISNQTIDISGWWLIDQNEQIKINFSNLANPKIKPNQFILLERTSDNTLPNISADLIYVGALSNLREGLRLFDQNCNLIDEVLANPSWPAGESTSRKTAERRPDFLWQTSNQVGGTPKAENSTSSFSILGGGGTMTPTNQSQTKPQNILISEIQIYPTNERFIELYNPNNFDIDLDGYYIQRKTQNSSSWQTLVSKTHFEGKKIKAQSFFLISRNPNPQANIVLENLTLTNSNSIQLKNKDGNILDLVGWGNASSCENQCAPEPQINQSIQRIQENNQIKDTNNNLADFQISNCPSPGQPPNFICSSTQASPDAFLKYTNTNHIVISEVLFNPKDSDEGQEFIELYNPTLNKIDLTQWSLKLIKANSTSTINLLTFKSGDLTQIQPQSFLLLGFSNYKNQNKPADVIRSTALPNDFEAIVLLDQNQNEIDRLDYKEYKNQNQPLAEGYSLERKAYELNCILPQESGEFLGNGCDSDEASDFVPRAFPNPQNSFSLPEPRKTPEINNLTIDFDSQGAEIKISWNESVDAQNNTSTLTYKILDKNSSTSQIIFEKQAKDINFSSSSFTYTFKVYELNKEYSYDFEIKDKDGLSSTSSLKILAQSFINDGYFFQDSTSGKYYFTLKLNPHHQFFDQNDTAETSSFSYQGIVFFLNQKPITPNILSTQNGMVIPDSSQIQVYYPSCGYTNHTILVFPQNKRSCLSFGQHLGTWAYDFSSLEDEIITIELGIDPAKNLTNNDYIALAFYGGWWANLAQEHFLGFIAQDSRLYNLEDNKNHLFPPTKPKIKELIFDDTSQKLTLQIEESTDPDSLDKNLIYEINYSTSTEPNPENWQKIPNINQGFSFDVLYPFNYYIFLRAKDEFENTSEIYSQTWSFPENFIVLASQTENKSSANNYAVALAQIFSIKEPGKVKGIKLYLASYSVLDWQRWQGELKVDLYKFNFEEVNLDNFKNSLTNENKITQSLGINNGWVSGSRPLSFGFPDQPYLEPGRYAWVLSLGGGYGHLGGICQDQGIGGYGYAAYSSSGWQDNYCGLAMTNYYFVLVGER